MKEPKWTTGFVLTNEVCGESNQSCYPSLTLRCHPHFSLPPWQDENMHMNKYTNSDVIRAAYLKLQFVDINVFLTASHWPATIIDFLERIIRFDWVPICTIQASTCNLCACHYLVQRISMYSHQQCTNVCTTYNLCFLLGELMITIPWATVIRDLEKESN